MIRVGVVGYGYWGPNLVRNFMAANDCTVSMVSDLNPDRLAVLQNRYPSISLTTSADELIASPSVDAVVVATPVHTHYPLALAALKAGKHVLVEKPITSRVDEAVHLVSEAEKRGLCLMVDHTFIYTGAVRKMKGLIDSGELGDLYYYDSTRVNLGLFQPDVNVLWDLAVHDLSILNYLVGMRPICASATGCGHVSDVENIGYLTLFYENKFIAHVNVNWLAPVKLRRTLISGTKKMVVFDDLEPSEKVKVYDNGLALEQDVESRYQTLIGYRTGDVCSPKIQNMEALALEAEEFLDSINKGRAPLTDGHAGLGVVRILEAATSSIKQYGTPVEITYD